MMGMQENSKRVLLFDIDGTLLDPANEGGVCLGRALEDVYGRTGPIDHYDMAGKTDWQIITDLMRMAGLDSETIDASLPAAFAAYARHVEIAAPTFNMQLLPGVTDLITQLADDPGFILGLVTGNVREAAPFKLQAVGLDPGLFTFGAFGSEHMDRNRLPALALYRLEQHLGFTVAPESALVIGDTPHDIACARHARVQVLCVATGTYSRQALEVHNPDYLLDNLGDTQAVMEILTRF
jgi:phosphoglycolate phosphatase-like HAD superfamily hydrolase